MIGQRELEKRASALGLSVRHVELDYVLNHLLAAIAEDPGDLIFRGGTALARVYWPDFRISEDLDFISLGAAPSLERMLGRSTVRAAESTGLALELEFGRPRGDRSRSFVRWSAPWETSGELLIDVVASERAVLEVQRRALVLPYSDLPKAAVIPVMDIAEILGNKWLMLDERDEPRDLFDLWWALAREAIPFRNDRSRSSCEVRLRAHARVDRASSQARAGMAAATRLSGCRSADFRRGARGGRDGIPRMARDSLTTSASTSGFPDLGRSGPSVSYPRA